MSLTLAQIKALAAQAVETASVDMSETSTGGPRALLPKGVYLARFKEYIELGKHAGEYQGKAKPPVLNARIGFELYAGQPDGSIETYQLGSFDLAIGNNEKAKAKIAFDRMNYKQTAKHFAELLGEAYLIEVDIVKGKQNGKERNEIVFATINPPIEPISRQPYPLPADNESTYRLFLWDVPTQEGWDSLFIDGTSEFEQDGKKVTKSKNFIQEKIINATDFQGSALERLLGGGVPDITQPVAVAAPVVAQVVAPVAAPVVAPVVPVQVPVTPVVPAIPTIPNLPGM